MPRQKPAKPPETLSTRRFRNREEPQSGLHLQTRILRANLKLELYGHNTRGREHA